MIEANTAGMEWLAPPPSEPLAVAREFLTSWMSDGAVLLLRSHRGNFFAFSGTCWPEHEERALRSALYAWLEHAIYEHSTAHGIELVPWAPTKAKIGNVLDALHAATHLAAAIAPPAWLDETDLGAADTIVSLANGLLNARTRELHPHTPAFFSQHSLPFAFEPDAPEPLSWISFLHELWEDDQDSIETLQEIFGYILSGETNQQKAFLFVGPKRSGKGTIGRILTGLLGAHNTAAPTLSGLTMNFGISPLIGKPLAVISDARLSSRADSMIAVERLLSISGEDTLTVDRKYQEPWTGRLQTRFMILTNELPRFADASGALASRFILLTLATSFYGRENPSLTGELLREAPGIFNWALTGLDRLLDRGYFEQPESAREALQHFEDLSSPVGAFIRDVCETGASVEIETDTLFTEWKHWCAEEGRPNPGTKAMFVKDLRAVAPGVRPVRRRAGDRRRRLLHGIALGNEHYDGSRPSPAHGLTPTTGPGWSEDHAIAADEVKQLANIHRDGHQDHPDVDERDESDFDALLRDHA
jgi:putative DNA primase/helicase